MAGDVGSITQAVVACIPAHAVGWPGATSNACSARQPSSAATHAAIHRVAVPGVPYTVNVRERGVDGGPAQLLQPPCLQHSLVLPAACGN